MNAPTTQEILAFRKLERSADARWIAWSIEMLAQGFDSPTLRIMAGETEPCHVFELWAMTDKVIAELGLTPFDDKHKAAIAVAVVRARQMLEGAISHRTGLAELSRLSHEVKYPDELTDFRMLHFAFEDLLDSESQWYWPETDRHTIREVIDENCRCFIEQHARSA